VTTLTKHPDAEYAAIEWAEWVRDWSGHLGTHSSPQTITTYLRGVRQFLDHLVLQLRLF